MNSVISESIVSTLPKYIINIIRYIWENELNCQEATFYLEKQDTSKQRITVYTHSKAVKSFVIPLANPIESIILFKQDVGGVTMILR